MLFPAEGEKQSPENLPRAQCTWQTRTYLAKPWEELQMTEVFSHWCWKHCNVDNLRLVRDKECIQDCILLCQANVCFIHGMKQAEPSSPVLEVISKRNALSRNTAVCSLISSLSCVGRERDPGTHCLRMLSSPKNYEIMVKSDPPVQWLPTSPMWKMPATDHALCGRQ